MGNGFSDFFGEGDRHKGVSIFIYETVGDANKFMITATATAESGMAGIISYDSATKTWSCTGDIIEKMLPEESA